MGDIILNNGKPSQALEGGGFRALSVEEKGYLGYQYVRDGIIYGDKRCDYCGKWFSWTMKQRAKYIENWNWKIEKGAPVRRKNDQGVVEILTDVINEEPIHCGSEHCQDYHNRVLKHEQRLASGDHEYYHELYKKMKEKKII